MSAPRFEDFEHVDYAYYPPASQRTAHVSGGGRLGPRTLRRVSRLTEVPVAEGWAYGYEYVVFTPEGSGLVFDLKTRTLVGGLRDVMRERRRATFAVPEWRQHPTAVHLDDDRAVDAWRRQLYGSAG